MLRSIRPGADQAPPPRLLIPDGSQATVMLAVAGEPGAGKATFARGLVDVLGADNVAVVATDHYRRFDRDREPPGLSPLHPDFAHREVLAQQLAALRDGHAILQPTYDEASGTLGAPVYTPSRAFVVARGVHAFAPPSLAGLFDLRVYLAPAEELRQGWSLGGQGAAGLAHGGPDAAAYVRPQRHAADVIVSFAPAPSGGAVADARLLVRDAVWADLSTVSGLARAGVRVEREDGLELVVPGDVDLTGLRWLEESVWSRLGRLGDGGGRRSSSLAAVQLLVLYHLTSRAVPPAEPIAMSL
jgi:phosphoribulokinase